MNFYTILQTRVGLLVSVYIEGGVGIFGFAVLVIFLIGFSVFAPKKCGFSVLVSFVVCGFSSY